MFAAWVLVLTVLLILSEDREHCGLGIQRLSGSAELAPLVLRRLHPGSRRPTAGLAGVAAGGRYLDSALGCCDAPGIGINLGLKQ